MKGVRIVILTPFLLHDKKIGREFDKWPYYPD